MAEQFAEAAMRRGKGAIVGVVVRQGRGFMVTRGLVECISVARLRCACSAALNARALLIQAFPVLGDRPCGVGVDSPANSAAPEETSFFAVSIGTAMTSPAIIWKSPTSTPLRRRKISRSPSPAWLSHRTARLTFDGGG